MPRYRLGIDIGGTFTDFSLLNEDTGQLTGFKSPTVPADPAAGVLEGLEALVAELGIAPGDIAYLVHGTTIAVNTVIERNGAALGLLVTRGFGDVLELQRRRAQRARSAATSPSARTARAKTRMHTCWTGSTTSTRNLVRPACGRPSMRSASSRS